MLSAIPPCSLPPPEAMAALTCLRALALQFPGLTMDPEVEAAALDAALQPLTQLTELSVLSDTLPRLPASLADLRQLRRCCLETPEARGAKLPPGDWLVGLQQLTLPAEIAVASRESLSGATQLQWMGLSDEEDAKLGKRQAQAYQGLLSILAQLPSLRCFCLESYACPARLQLAAQRQEGGRLLPLRTVCNVWQAWAEANEG